MDIYCPRCNEPVELDYIHDVVEGRRIDGDDTATYDTVAADYRVRGCPALDGTCNPDTIRTGDTAAGVIFELLGDDMDGAAAMMEDMDMMSGRWQ